MFNLVIQSFGRENEYRRAIFTVFSFYAHVSAPRQQRVLLFTDVPAYFEPYFAGLPVDYILLTPEKIKAMRGEIDFLHRMKIALIEEAFTVTDAPMFYADSDTFFIADPTPYLQRVTPSLAFMHVLEYPFGGMKDWPLPAGETFRAFYNLITTRAFTGANGNPVQVTPEQASWNAGVMVFHPSHARLIPDVFALTDQFYPPSGNHASEQYAFSVVLQSNTELQRCDDVIYHYWYRMKKKIVDAFLETRLTGEWAAQPLAKKTAVVKNWADAMICYFDTHTWTLQDNAIQAFNENKFRAGYTWAGKALLKKPLDKAFIKDLLYHIKRHLKQ